MPFTPYSVLSASSPEAVGCQLQASISQHPASWSVIRGTVAPREVLASQHPTSA